ncbi:MAG: nitroreductase [Pseudomonadales bacterium]|nr:nitroreductase [Pseudomonadales bacterium]
MNSVREVLENRRSVREYTNQPVSADLVQEILSVSGKSASGSNLQPWKIYAISGSVKNRLCETVMQRLALNPSGEKADIPIYPKPLPDPFRQRRYDCGELMYRALNIPREDKIQRLMQVAKNFSFFGAPVGLIFTINRTLCESQILDTGILVQSIMLMAKEQGLDTCAQASWTLWPQTIREVLGIDEAEMVLLGMSLGYAKQDELVNEIKQPRIVMDEYVKMMGF